MDKRLARAPYSRENEMKNEQAMTMTPEQLMEMIEAYLDNGIFTVSDYAELEFAGLTAMAAENWDADRMDCIRFKNGDFDGLSDFAHEKALAEGLVPGHDYR